jgi:hypothetical protein
MASDSAMGPVPAQPESRSSKSFELAMRAFDL